MAALMDFLLGQLNDKYDADEEDGEDEVRYRGSYMSAHVLLNL